MSVHGTRARVEAALAARMWIVAALTCTIVCVMLAARRPDQITNPQFWAEDGAIPAVMLIWNLVLVRGVGRWAARALLACAAMTFAVHHRSVPLIDYHWREASACIGAQPTCEIAINPTGWKVVVRSRQ